MKNKSIIAALMSLLVLCSCGKTSGDLPESSTVTQTESTAALETEEITETETSAETSETYETKTSETLLELSSYDMIPMLERPAYREPQAVIMPENIEFTLDLKDITPDTDLFSLTNMEKHSIDENFKMDLDGDGIEEEISVAENFYKLEGKLRVLTVTINGKTYNLDRSHEGFMNVPTGIFTCDIDSSDNYIEIACSGSGATNDYLTFFFRYENGELLRIFDIGYDTPDGNGESDMFFDKMNASVTGKPIITDGSGIITAARRLDAQTWLAYSHYVYDSESGEISLVCEPVYPYYYENIDNFDIAKEFTAEWYIPDVVPERPLPKTLIEVTLYKEPDLNSGTLTLEPQDCYITAEYFCPDEAWIYLAAKDGTSGWCNLNEDNYDVYKGRVLYD